jgi:hypothetical protein
MPLAVTVQRYRETGAIAICFINDLAVDERPPGTCDSCGQRSELPLGVLTVNAREALCDACLRARVESNLDGCFHPGRGSGTGLGLFVIKHFLEEYYYGMIHSGIESWDAAKGRYMVYFRLVVPDDLAQAISEKNAMWSATS